MAQALPVMPRDVAEILVDHAAYADHRIHDAHRWLRENMPLAIVEADGYQPFVAVTRHADVMEISRNNKAFGNADRPISLIDQQKEAAVRALTNGSANYIRMIIHMDQPDHMRYRLLTQKWFMPQNVRKLEDDIRAMARRTVDRMEGLGGRCDFASDVALHYPLHVIMSILGVPESDEPLMLSLTQDLFGRDDPDKTRTAPEEANNPAAYAAMVQGIIDDFGRYFTDICIDRRAHPKDDLATVIANAEIDGKPISDFDAMAYYMLVATAGHDTTSASSAGALWGLAQNPSEFAKVKNDLSLVDAMIEEAIRWITPVRSFMRTAFDDIDYRGMDVRKDDWFQLCYMSANRDETVFDNAHDFIIDRPKKQHMAFGYGAHMCLGQHLAKLELRILFEELIPRLKRVEIDGEPSMVKSYNIGGVKTMPIRFEFN